MQGLWFWTVATCWRKAGKEQKYVEGNVVGASKKQMS